MNKTILQNLIIETSKEVDEIFKREQGSSLYHYTQGKLNAYRNLLSDINDIVKTDSTFIRVSDPYDKQYMLPKHKVEYITANPESLSILIITETGESYNISFNDDDKFHLQVDYLHKQLGIL